MNISPSAFRHEKEAMYLGISSVIGVILWIILIVVAIPFLLPLAIFLWLMGQYFKTEFYGNAVHVNKGQFEEVYQTLADMASRLKLSRVPDVFVVSGQGVLSAAAIRFLSARFIVLHGEVVDLLLRRDAHKELGMVLGHELAHHVLGHTSLWKNLLLLPSRVVPFLGSAYQRACELSADRLGMVLVGDGNAARQALVALTCGSEVLTEKVNLEVFAAQEQQVSRIMGFLHGLYASHPRMTRRIMELKQYETDPVFQSHVRQA